MTTCPPSCGLALRAWIASDDEHQRITDRDVACRPSGLERADNEGFEGAGDRRLETFAAVGDISERALQRNS